MKPLNSFMWPQRQTHITAPKAHTRHMKREEFCLSIALSIWKRNTRTTPKAEKVAKKQQNQQALVVQSWGEKVRVSMFWGWLRYGALGKKISSVWLFQEKDQQGHIEDISLYHWFLHQKSPCGSLPLRFEQDNWCLRKLITVSPVSTALCPMCVMEKWDSNLAPDILAQANDKLVKTREMSNNGKKIKGSSFSKILALWKKWPQ